MSYCILYALLAVWVAAMATILVFFNAAKPLTLIIGLYAISIAPIVTVVVTASKSIEECAKLQLKNKIITALKQNKSSIAEDYLQSENFSIEKVIKLMTSGWSSQELLLDNTGRRLVFKTGKKYSKILKYSDIESYEVVENGNSVVKGTAGKALIGGAFFGLGGILIGSSMDRKILEKCNSLKLIIRINDFDSPEIIVTYIDNVKYDKTGFLYKNMKKNIQSVCSMLEFVINNKTIENQDIVQENNQVTNTNSIKDQVKELKEMLDDGLITQEEFDQKKKQILGL